MQGHSITNRGRGFSFVEVLFAVIILGIGFIMVAAIFPVAMQQTKLTTEQITSAAIGRNGVSYVAGVANDKANNPPAAQSSAATRTNVVPTSGTFFPLSAAAYPYTPPPLIEPLDLGPNLVPLYMIDTAVPHAMSMKAVGTEITYLQGPQKGVLARFLQQNLINPDDPRSAFVMLYSRGGYYNDVSTWSGQAQIIVVPVQSRVNSVFTASDLDYNLQPHPVRFAVLPRVAVVGGADLIIFDVTNTVPEANSVLGITGTGGAVVEGACVVVGNDNIAGPTHNVGRMNGRIFKVGARRSELDNSISALTYSVTVGTNLRFATISGTANTLSASLPGHGIVYELDPSTPMSTDVGQDDTLSPVAPGLAPIVALGSDPVISYSSPPPPTMTALTVAQGDAQLAGVSHYGLAEGWVVGRSLADREASLTTPAARDTYEGANMAGNAYSGFITVK